MFFTGRFSHAHAQHPILNTKILQNFENFLIHLQRFHAFHVYAQQFALHFLILCMHHQKYGANSEQRGGNENENFLHSFAIRILSTNE